MANREHRLSKMQRHGAGQRICIYEQGGPLGLLQGYIPIGCLMILWKNMDNEQSAHSNENKASKEVPLRLVGYRG